MSDHFEEYKEFHLIDKDLKKEHLDDGEWVNEPDLVYFKYRDYDCIVKRLFKLERYNPDDCFGGNINGYIIIEKDHPLYGIENNFDADLDIHGGVTFSGFIFYDFFQENDFVDKFAIGFDCAHAFDIVPSMETLKEKIRKTEPRFLNAYKILKERRKNSPFGKMKTYKNVVFVINELKSGVDQLIEMKVKCDG